MMKYVLAASVYSVYSEKVKFPGRVFLLSMLVFFSALPTFVAAATNEGVEDEVRAYFADAPVLISIARCESRFRMFSDGKPLDGGAGGMIGVYQINSGVHAKFAKKMGMDIYTLNGNLAYARYLYEREGTRPWVSSKVCWEKASEAAGGSKSEIATSTAFSVATREEQIAHLKAIIAALTEQISILRRDREFASL